jgi:hypothetical protein
MMEEEAPETRWATHKRQVINLWNCCILLVNLFESYDNARTYERQIYKCQTVGKSKVLLKSDTITGYITLQYITTYVPLWLHLTDLFIE